MTYTLMHVPKPDNDELWELWCLKVFAKQYNVPGLTRYRTRGYPQEGVDLIGTRADGKIVGIQCKLRSTEKALTEKEADADLAMWLASGLDLGVFAIACSHESTALQTWAKSKCHAGLEVTFYAWPNIADILKGDATLRDELTDGNRVNDARDELAYSHALIDLRDRMTLYAMEKAATEVREPPLTAAYVSLELSAVARDGDESRVVGGSCSIESVLDSLHSATWTPNDAPIASAKELGRFNLAEREAEASKRPGNVLLLVGEAGRGKTTLLRYIAVRAAKERCDALGKRASLPEYRTKARALSWRDRVPFYREVRLATPERPIDDLDHAAYDILKSNSRSVAAHWPRSIVDAGRALVLLDGVDEVPDGQPRITLLENIYELVKQNPETLFVISSRPGAADGLRRKLAAFTPHEARVQALAGPKLSEFIRHWHGAVKDVAETIFTGKPKEDRVAEVSQALVSLPPKLDAARHIKSLMATPLLAALVCAYHLDHDSLPDDQTELMTNLAYCLIDYHDRLRPGMPTWPAYSDLKKGDKLRILGIIAANMVQRLSPTIVCNVDEDGGTDDFDTHIREFMKTAPWFNETHIEHLRAGLKDRTGVLHEMQRGVLSFIHNEFRDFLAARHLAPQADSHEVYAAMTKAMDNRDWHGLIFFAVTADRDKQRSGVADRLVAELLKVVNAPPTNLLAKESKTEAEMKTVENYLSLRRIAFRIAGAKPPVTADVYADLQRVRGSMLPPATMEDAEIISELGKNALPELAYDANREASVRTACAYALRLIDRDDARTALRAYAQHDTDPTVLEEVAQTVPVADIAFFARGITQAASGFSLPNEMRTRLVRQAAGLVQGVPAGPARALVRQLAVLHITDSDEALGLFGSVQPDAGPFAARVVFLSASENADGAISALAAKHTGLRYLTSLHLRQTQMTEVGAMALATKDSGLLALTELVFHQTSITDDSIAALASKDSGLRALTRLHLYSARITTAGAAALAAKDSGLRALTELYLSHTTITDEGVAALAGLPVLTSLALSEIMMTDAGLLKVATTEGSLKHLKELYLGGTTISDDGIANAFGPSCKLASLEVLSIAATKTTDAVAEWLSSSRSGLVSLKTLYLGNSQHCGGGRWTWSPGHTITDASVHSLARPETCLRSLTTLDLQGTHITDVGAAALAARDSGLRDLTLLNLRDTKVTDAGEASIKAAHPNLKVVR